jgi:hypothetical protein
LNLSIWIWVLMVVVAKYLAIRWRTAGLNFSFPCLMLATLAVTGGKLLFIWQVMRRNAPRFAKILAQLVVLVGPAVGAVTFVSQSPGRDSFRRVCRVCSVDGLSVSFVHVFHAETADSKERRGLSGLAQNLMTRNLAADSGSGEPGTQ